jgi:hypothetical protein
MTENPTPGAAGNKGNRKGGDNVERFPGGRNNGDKSGGKASSAATGGAVKASMIPGKKVGKPAGAAPAPFSSPLGPFRRGVTASGTGQRLAAVPAADGALRWVPIRSSEAQQAVRRRIGRNPGTNRRPGASRIAAEPGQISAAIADREAGEAEAFSRVAGSPARRVTWVRLGSRAERVVRIDRDGWKVTTTGEEGCPVFVRDAGTGTMPAPKVGAPSLIALMDRDRYLPRGEETRRLAIRSAIAWLVSGLTEQGPCVVPVVNGEPGAAGSSTMRWLRMPIDPVAKGAPPCLRAGATREAIILGASPRQAVPAGVSGRVRRGRPETAGPRELRGRPDDRDRAAGAAGDRPDRDAGEARHDAVLHAGSVRRARSGAGERPGRPGRLHRVHRGRAHGRDGRGLARSGAARREAGPGGGP